jgi:predicted 2-oxoglutarate/Fe(II)-dependent dioxygenase YbiX
MLVFLGRVGVSGSTSAMATLDGARSMFDGVKASLFCVTADPLDEHRVQDRPGLRWFFDFDFAVSRLYGAAPTSMTPGQGVVYRPHAVLLDPQLRVHAIAKLDQIEELLRILHRLPDPADHAGVELSAPILVIPRVFEAGLCEHLIGLYEGGGAEISGVMRQRGERTVYELDDEFKSRSDHVITDRDVIDALRGRIRRRVVPAIERFFQFAPTYIERHLVACYDSSKGGFFRPHRDNTTPGTAHRRFAVSINLNDDFSGGELVFPEFGMRRYKVPAGAALVFGCGLLHWVLPMTAGRRFAYLPFLYDAAAAEIRDANRPLVDTELSA